MKKIFIISMIVLLNFTQLSDASSLRVPMSNDNRSGLLSKIRDMTKERFERLLDTLLSDDEIYSRTRDLKEAMEEKGNNIWGEKFIEYIDLSKHLEIMEESGLTWEKLVTDYIELHKELA